MAIRFMDSFDHYATPNILNKWSQMLAAGIDNLPVIGLTGRHGSSGIRWPISSNYAGRVIVKTLPAVTGNIVVIGFAWRMPYGTFTDLYQGTNHDPTYYNSSNSLVTIRNASVAHIWVRINPDGTITVCRGHLGSSSALGTTNLSLPLNAYVFIELKVLIDSTNGTVELRVNNEEWLKLTSVNTQYAASATWSEVHIGGIRCGNATMAWDYDDLYVLDGSGPAPWNNFLGDCRVDTSYVESDTATTDWVPLSGLINAAMVDEQVPDDDITYNYTTTVGATDKFVVGNAVPGSVIQGVQVCLHVKKADAGACTLAPVVAGIQGSQTVNPNSGSYAYALFPYEKNPATGLAWTIAEFNAAEFGYKRTE